LHTLRNFLRILRLTTMRTKFITPLFLIFNILCFSALAQKDFTNKSQAKNELKNGIKEGKWVEYIDNRDSITTDTAAPFYKLTVYKSGKPFGIMREYTRKGILYIKIPYSDGKENGDAILYYDDGVVEEDIPCTDGKRNGVGRTYYISGALKSETSYADGKKNGPEKEYYENGKLKGECPYKYNKKEGIDKIYGEN